MLSLIYALYLDPEDSAIHQECILYLETCWELLDKREEAGGDMLETLLCIKTISDKISNPKISLLTDQCMATLLTSKISQANRKLKEAEKAKEIHVSDFLKDDYHEFTHQ